MIGKPISNLPAPKSRVHALLPTGQPKRGLSSADSMTMHTSALSDERRKTTQGYNTANYNCFENLPDSQSQVVKVY